eukprot:scaffold94175_cov67-Phaeocystis_antarctica.AAC.3
MPIRSNNPTAGWSAKYHPVRDLFTGVSACHWCLREDGSAADLRRRHHRPRSAAHGGALGCQSVGSRRRADAHRQQQRWRRSRAQRAARPRGAGLPSRAAPRTLTLTLAPILTLTLALTLTRSRTARRVRARGVHVAGRRRQPRARAARPRRHRADAVRVGLVLGERARGPATRAGHRWALPTVARALVGLRAARAARVQRALCRRRRGAPRALHVT